MLCKDKKIFPSLQVARPAFLLVRSGRAGAVREGDRPAVLRHRDHGGALGRRGREKRTAPAGEKETERESYNPTIHIYSLGF